MTGRPAGDAAGHPPDIRAAARPPELADAIGAPDAAGADRDAMVGAHASDPAGGGTMPAGGSGGAMVSELDRETAMLVAVAAVVAGGSESVQREMLRRALPVVRPEWIEEVLLQSYLFAGFPRALNAMRIWRGVSGLPAPASDDDAERDDHDEWMRRGLATCEAVYGHFYDRLRVNITALHPALDAWMVTHGYGMVLGRPALDLARRELCVIAACVAAQQDRQLHSHLHGALHVGAAPAAVAAAVDQAIIAMGPALDDDAPHRYRQLWLRVLARHRARLAGIDATAARLPDPTIRRDATAHGATTDDRSPAVPSAS